MRALIAFALVSISRFVVRAAVTPARQPRGPDMEEARIYHSKIEKLLQGEKP
jgi:hypothetical protein